MFGCGKEVGVLCSCLPRYGRALDESEVVDVGLALGGLYGSKISTSPGPRNWDTMKLGRPGQFWPKADACAKSGVMLWSYDEGLRASYADATFDTPRGAFPKVSSYKYLGIEVSEDLPLFMGGDTANLLQGKSTDAMLYAKSLAAKGLTALSTLKPILRESACPLPLKAELVKAFVMSVMAYGSEFLGFNKKLAAPVQRVIDLALRWCVGLKKSNKSVASMVLSVELGIPLIYEFYAGQRARLFHKLKLGDPPMKTLLVSLQADHAFHPQRTWCSENEFWLKRFHAPQKSERGWQWGKGGKYKYAMLEVQPDNEIIADYWEVQDPRTPHVKTFYQEGLDWMSARVAEWYKAGAVGDSAWGDGEETRNRWKIKEPRNPIPVRGWYSFARMAELHRRSNRYQSDVLASYRRMILGVDEMGRVLYDPHDLPYHVLVVLLRELKSSDEVEEARRKARDFLSDRPHWHANDLALDRQMQDVAYGGKKSDEGARLLFIREVRECALERLFSVDGSRLASFTDWYDRFQFDLPPLWGNGGDRLGLDTFGSPVLAFGRYFCPAVAKTIFEVSPELPNSVKGLPYGKLTTNRHTGLIRFAMAIRLAGGCILDPRESVYLLSYGQMDYILTELGQFGYVFMASFLQAVAPLYCGAMGLNNPQVLDLALTSSLRGSGGASPSGVSTKEIEVLDRQENCLSTDGLDDSEHLTRRTNAAIPVIVGVNTGSKGFSLLQNQAWVWFLGIGLHTSV
ncbi:hypothetical protein HD554DRAFT_2043522 [Boletus coccyginus]|nr:hypothetical protein HD554DRAFT_2043522 [Boletus coccyginus]